MLYTTEQEKDHAVLICDCHDPQHHVSIWIDREFHAVTLSTSIESAPFLVRLWRGLRYAFTGKSLLFSSLDEVLLYPQTVKALIAFLSEGVSQ